MDKFNINMNIFKKSIKKKVVKEIRQEIGYYTTWLPGKPVELGDVGKIINGSFERLSNLKNLGIKFEIVKDKTKSDFEYKSKDSVEENVTLDGKKIKLPISCIDIVNAKIAIEFDFTREGAVVLVSEGELINRIDDIIKLEKDIKALDVNKKWDKDYVVITEVVISDKVLILVSNSELSSSKFEIGADITIPKITKIADFGLNMESVSHNEMGCNYLTKEKSVALFKMYKLKKHLFSGSTLDVRKSIALNLESENSEYKSLLKEVDIDDLF